MLNSKWKTKLRESTLYLSLASCASSRNLRDPYSPRSSTSKVDAATKRSIFAALSSHITARDTDDAETLSVLLDVLLLLRGAIQ